ncbi:Uncharacterized protein PHSC3_000109 [Chlamydiales bacterium STE3]|nr:Uncharacterized protein PHSC3_000109 [Chlamydiales bacterium STE3]
MKASKKDKGEIVDVEEDLQLEMKEFAEAYDESLKETCVTQLEPFEMYAKKVRREIFSNVKMFKKRFSAGFQVLQDEINEESK